MYLSHIMPLEKFVAILNLKSRVNMKCKKKILENIIQRP